MNKILTLVFFFLLQSVNDQVESGISIFHRLLILNAENELMVVKIENSDFWVTPGFYQKNELSIKNGLDSIASLYGIEIEALKLNGLFLLQIDVNNEKSTSLRNVYTSKLKKRSFKMPKGISEIKWLSIDKVLKQISFPHISAIIEIIMTHPNEVWSGTLRQFKEKDIWKTSIIEEFYSL